MPDSSGAVPRITIGLRGRGPSRETYARGRILLRPYKAGLYLVDLSLPKDMMDGFETIRALRKIYPEAKIVVITVSSGLGAMKYAMEAGANGYMIKEHR